MDGKALTEKQKKEILEKMNAEEKAENPDFDPRKHRLIHGIRNYREAGQTKYELGAFEGKGIKLG